MDYFLCPFGFFYNQVRLCITLQVVPNKHSFPKLRYEPACFDCPKHDLIPSLHDFRGNVNKNLRKKKLGNVELNKNTFPSRFPMMFPLIRDRSNGECLGNIRETRTSVAVGAM
uniref:Uncharacterized protein n=1 Tax=Cacopsylla melanoneura TaxID=428564 RepID=A0A8D9B370_9HEMI